MSTGVTNAEVAGGLVEDRVPDRRCRRDERRRLARQDALAARLAELHRMRALLEEAVAVVTTGWVQNAWFTVVDAHGGQVRVTAHDIDRIERSPVSGACLVGGIVHAGGGPGAVHSQLVQRTLDLTWHTLYEDEQRPVRWCPSPPVRSAHVRDLTRWNDHPHRTPQDVVALLGSAAHAADVQIGLTRAARG